MASPKRKLLKVVVDTNLFVSGLIVKGGYPSELLSKWKGKSFILVISNKQREEIIYSFNSSLQLSLTDYVPKILS